MWKIWKFLNSEDKLIMYVAWSSEAVVCTPVAKTEVILD